MDPGLELRGLVSALFPVYLATLSGSICWSGGAAGTLCAYGDS